MIDQDVGVGAWRPQTVAQYLALISPAKFQLFGGAAGALKALTLDTPIATPSGWTTMGEISVGDSVFDENGDPCAVIDVSPVRIPRQMYAVTFEDGEVIRADGGHLWKTMTVAERAQAIRSDEAWKAERRAKRPSRSTGASPWLALRNSMNRKPGNPPSTGSVRTTEEIADTVLDRRKRTNHSVDVCGSLSLPDAELPISPYLLGVWLGDGHTNGAVITKPDGEVFDFIREEGWTVTDHAEAINHGVLGLHAKLRDNGLLGNKHIPAVYFRASHDQRLALLRGLMDTDGCAQKNGACYFSNCNRRLVDGVRELICSLGMKAVISEGRAILNGKDYGPSYAIHFTPNVQVFRLPRKANRLRIATRPTTRRRYIVKVERIEPVPVRCIAVSSPSHLYLAGRAFIPTHNSETILIDAILERDNPRLRGILLRKSFPELQRSLIRRSREIYPSMGARYHEQNHCWTFPSGATVEFGHCEKETDIYRYQGSEFSYIAFDESTHFPEFSIRYMVSRLRSTDSSLRQRVRLATNPGNVGHKYTRDTFLGPVCTHCGWVEGKSRKPFALYDDAEWSDGVPIGMTTCFIPGRLSDHNLLGEAYRKQLESLPRAHAQALLDGCWAVWEGQYFACWDASRMVVPRASVEPKSWWPRWVGVDYGYGESSAVGIMLTRSDPEDRYPRGRIYVIGEYIAKNQKAQDFARVLKAKFGTSDHVNAWYLDPSVFSERGGEEHDIAAQMSEASKIPFEPAQRDRPSGSQLMLSMLESGELIVCDNCPVTIDMIPTRIHDSDNPVAVAKVKGKQEDDVFDALRYGLASYSGPGRPSLEARMAQAITASDPTCRAIQAQVVAATFAQENEPTRIIQHHRYRMRGRRAYR